MTTDEAWEHARRYVVLAEWVEPGQSSSGWYRVTLSCGHRMECSSACLTAAMLCQECFRENLAT